MVDIDGLESCSRPPCRTPLLLVETARDVGQDIKPASALVGLAAKADVPAVILLWTPSEMWRPEPPHCECQERRRKVPGCDHGVAGFRARHIYPQPTKWKRCTPEQIAAWIDSLHRAHMASHHTTISWPYTQPTHGQPRRRLLSRVYPQWIARRKRMR